MDLYCGNLCYETGEDSLRQLFGEYGTVDHVKIIVDHDTGRSKGFAFITMSDNEEASRAVEALNDFEFGGRPLKVNEARPREERPRGNFGGGGGGFNRGGGGGGNYNRGGSNRSGGGGGFRRGSERRGNDRRSDGFR